MAKPKPGFDEFIASVDESCEDFVRKLDADFTAAGAKIEVKEAKSGYMVSYKLGGKTVINFVFRKKGLIIRIYANHVNEYMDFLDTMSADMKSCAKNAPDCRRLLNPEDCNPKCQKGYQFVLDGEFHQKCRIGAFMFAVTDENKPSIAEFVARELNACLKAS